MNKVQYWKGKYGNRKKHVKYPASPLNKRQLFNIGKYIHPLPDEFLGKIPGRLSILEIAGPKNKQIEKEGKMS